jgi:SpoVK/Ycf46/Vps4 family AAA+-type ATPase
MMLSDFSQTSSLRFFPLPDREARKEIIRIHTKKFDPPLPEVLYDELADVTRGYCGSDLKALCTEGMMY